MTVLQNEQLLLLKQNINEMIIILETYDIYETAKFRPILRIISKNIEQCIRCDFDGINELSTYVYEDWRSVCVGENGIEKWYLKIADLGSKSKLNEAFEKASSVCKTRFNRLNYECKIRTSIRNNS